MTMLPAPRAAWKLPALIALVAVASGAATVLTWQIQDWRYGAKLERQARLHSDTLNELTLAGASLQRTEQEKRLVLERRLQASDQTHHSELTNAQQTQKRLNDRLATADLRLSVLLVAYGSAGGSVPTNTGAGGVVHGTRRAELDPAHAQRIIGITDDGDRGLIALRACQQYALDVSSQ
ncbi:lysis system i-spanin subunit Rz [Pseudomonas sp. W2Oct36]|uniref:lysis system i-spanin subunit Rz n=1 Tax=Pseudomonas sp. W2Oct36 TaxID=1215284 RepID=UPI0034E0D438